jgi:hypothetical protein
MKPVKVTTENKHLAKLSEGKAYIKWLKKKFPDLNVPIDANKEYALFLIDHPEYK